MNKTYAIALVANLIFVAALPLNAQEQSNIDAATQQLFTPDVKTMQLSENLSSWGAESVVSRLITLDTYMFPILDPTFGVLINRVK